ncbi:MAG: hypothetical protein MJE12_03735, partial [Alphaproteobacteria bacterium]|nr:hypothetical protein [Alphaproteobacteria bacterium]
MKQKTRFRDIRQKYCDAIIAPSAAATRARYRTTSPIVKDETMRELKVDEINGVSLAKPEAG